MRRRSLALFLLPLATAIPILAAPGWKVIGWNDLGMHCMDGKDYSVYSILPPFNTFHAQVVDPNGKLVKSGANIRLSYTAVADANKSINKSTIGKTNFWDYVQPLFQKSLAPDTGLAGFKMPGASNTPQSMSFETPQNWFTATGVPISPYDDNGVKNYYPMMRLTAKDSKNQTLAYTDIVLPVSDELDCKSCHASYSSVSPRPSIGWSMLTDPEKQFKMNVLAIHDDRNRANPLYATVLSRAGYKTSGLVDTVTAGKPIVCAQCHLSNALGMGYKDVSQLTTAVHKHHANAVDPTNNLILDAIDNRSACHRCHPGSTTKCLRGVMGNDASIQCQSCHGGMNAVGSNRVGWLDEPACQNCHTGTALKNNGQIRYTTALDSGARRQAADLTFATNANTPAAGLNLYRFSSGHGGMQCESCHGSTHAEYPTNHPNDDAQNIRLQGYAGVIRECAACHSSVPNTASGGPHGMHTVGQAWVGSHGDTAERNAGQCQGCHGIDYRGTVLSAVKVARNFNIEGRAISIAAGTQVGCYNCHNGPRGGN